MLKGTLIDVKTLNLKLLMDAELKFISSRKVYSQYPIGINQDLFGL